MAPLPSPNNKVLMGSCGWSDNSIVQCGRFYPKSATKTAEARLRHYSTYFPTVEVDTSNYSIPKQSAVEAWVNATPPNFIFHFKAYAMFTQRKMKTDSLPYFLKETLSPSQLAKQNTSYDELPAESLALLWDRFHESMAPAQEKKKLGVILFQFPLNFGYTTENLNFLLELRSKLKAEMLMAVEFRERGWIKGRKEETIQFCKDNKLILVAADELEHETFLQPAPIGDPVIQERIVTVTNSAAVYVRVHRREGTERVLRDFEFDRWKNDLVEVCSNPDLNGPVYFLWGTDHEDQPIINSRRLSSMLSDLSYAPIWQGHVGQREGSLTAMFSKQSKKQLSDASADGGGEEGGAAQESTDSQYLKKEESTETDEKKRTSSSASSIGSVSTPSSAEKRMKTIESMFSGSSAAAVKKSTSNPPKGTPSIQSFFSKK